MHRFGLSHALVVPCFLGWEPCLFSTWYTNSSGIAFDDPLKGDGVKLLPYLFDFQHMLSTWRQFDQRLVDRVDMWRVL